MALENLGSTSEEAEPPPQQEAACTGETKTTGLKQRAVLVISTAPKWLVTAFLLCFKIFPYIALGVTVNFATELGPLASAPSVVYWLPFMVIRT